MKKVTNDVKATYDLIHQLRNMLLMKNTDRNAFFNARTKRNSSNLAIDFFSIASFFTLYVPI